MSRLKRKKVTIHKIKLIKTLFYSFICSTLLMGLSSCNTKQYLSEGELYLKNNYIVYKKELSNKNAAKVKTVLPELMRITPNSGILWIPRHWFYYRNKKLQKENWYWNFINKNVAENPAIIEEDVLKETAHSMTLYLKNNAYFDATVSYDIDTLRQAHEGQVIWNVYPHHIYLYDSFSIVSRDTVIQHILDNNWRNRIIEPGMAISRDNYNAELDRILTLLRNNGYPNFPQTYIDKFTVDTSGQSNSGYIRVLTPPDSDFHPRYRNRNIYIISSKASEKQLSASPDSQQVDSVKIQNDAIGIHFIGKNFMVRPSAIAKNITLNPGAIYSRRKYDLTQTQLGSFAIYHFPTSQLKFDTLNGDYYVDYYFHLKPDSLYSTMIMPAIYHSTISNSNQLLGLSLDMSLTNRNIFGGGEAYTIATEGAMELSLVNLKDNNTYSVGISNDLEFPRFIRFPLIYDYIETLLPTREEDIHADNHLVWRFLREASTKTTLNYRFALRNSAFSYHSFSASFGYSWNINEYYKFELYHVGFEWWIPTIFQEFYDLISDNEFFLRSFDQRLMTGILFRRARLAFATPRANYFGENWLGIVDLETSGLEIMGIDAIRGLMGYAEDIHLGENQFSKYARLELTGVYKKKYQNNTELAFRVKTGIAVPMDTSNVPYIRQFYVGGPYSLRAWPVRGIGPGGHYAPEVIKSRFPPYFTGNFKLEANAEYRFKMFWYFHGALFLDVGNVWNLFGDDFSGNTLLQWDSYKQIAIGSGFGIRFDYTLFVFRLDLGYPIKNPYKIEGSYFAPVRDWSFNNIQWNIAFGYPF